MFTFFGLGNFFLIPGQYWRHTDDFFLAYTTGSRSQIVPFLLTVFCVFFSRWGTIHLGYINIPSYSDMSVCFPGTISSQTSGAAQLQALRELF